jgi:hypothetical protein
MDYFNPAKPSKQKKGLRWISIIIIGVILILLPLWFYFYYRIDFAMGYHKDFFVTLSDKNGYCDEEYIFGPGDCRMAEIQTLIVFGLAIAGGVITLKGLAGLKRESNKFDKILLVLFVIAVFCLVFNEYNECSMSKIKLRNKLMDLMDISHQCDLEKDNVSYQYRIQLQGCKISKNGCYHKLAVQMLDPSLCKMENIDDSNSAEESLSWCYSDIGIAKRNVSICDMIETNTSAMVYSSEHVAIRSAKDYCYEQVAAETKNPFICSSRIMETSERDVCYSEVAWKMKDPMLCQNLTDQDKIRARCYMNVAVIWNDPTICSYLEGIDPDIMASCYKKISDDSSKSVP